MFTLKAGEPLDILFDPAVPFGSKAHYFHFLHGYLLPGLHHAVFNGRHPVRFEDCGPIMTPRIVEACSLLSIPLEPPAPDQTPKGFVAPRWDRLLLHFDAPPPPSEVFRDFNATCTPLRQQLLEAARHVSESNGQLARWLELDVIVFERSYEHPYYRSPGMARFPGYGRGRRHLVNGSDIVTLLQQQGLRAEILDLGALSLADQITACHQSRAVIGVRGAEFANLIWMRPRSAALMLGTPVKRENYGTSSLATAFDVSFRRIPVDYAQVSLSQAQLESLKHELLKLLD